MADFLRQTSDESAVSASDVLKQRRDRLTTAKLVAADFEAESSSPQLQGVEIATLHKALIEIQNKVDELCQKQSNDIDRKLDGLASSISTLATKMDDRDMRLEQPYTPKNGPVQLMHGKSFGWPEGFGNTAEPLRIGIEKTDTTGESCDSDRAGISTDHPTSQDKEEKEKRMEQQDITVQNLRRSKSSESNDSRLSADLPKKPRRLSLRSIGSQSSASIASRLSADSSQKSKSNNAPASQPVQWNVSGNRERTKLQKTVWLFLEDPDVVAGGRLFKRTFTAVIIASFLSNLLPLIEDLPLGSLATEVVVVLDCLFLLEVSMRFWASPNRRRFFFSFYNDLDLASAVIPMVMRMSVGESPTSADIHPAALLLFCWMPILRLLKLLRRFDTFSLLIMAFQDALEALPVLLYMLGVLIMAFSAVIYVFEKGASVDSLPKAVWFAVVTVSTVGYGDTTPETLPGHITVTIFIVISALYMAIPLAIVGKAFGNVWDNRRHLLLLHRLRTRFLTAGYRVEDIPAMFCNFDINADGELSKAEFRDMLIHMEIEMSKGLASDIFTVFDADGSGAIDDIEFVKTLFPEIAEELDENLGESGHECSADDQATIG